jgi:peptide-methionine (S)-S-oxide reductase
MVKNAVLAGGCFWGMEDLFRDLHSGIISTETGYAGGTNENPTYQNHPGHAEALLVEYDDAKITYRELLDFFFRIHNPTTLNQQGNDRGTSYRSTQMRKSERKPRRSLIW